MNHIRKGRQGIKIEIIKRERLNLSKWKEKQNRKGREEKLFAPPKWTIDVVLLLIWTNKGKPCIKRKDESATHLCNTTSAF